jgi:hypothetical protein
MDEKEPQVRPEYYYVVSEAAGFVGAFYSAEDAESFVVQHHSVPFLVQKFPVLPGPVSRVWVVLYRDVDAVAFLSNSREESERVQKEFAKVGQTYPDSIDFWEHRANEVSEQVSERLKSISRAHDMYARMALPTAEELLTCEMEDLERINRLTAPNPNGPLARIMREHERITIFDCVVPVCVNAPKDESAAPPDEESIALGNIVASAEQVIAAAERIIATAKQDATNEDVIAAAEQVIAATERVVAIASDDGEHAATAEEREK